MHSSRDFFSFFPVPRYMKLGSVSCAIDHDTFRFIEFTRKRSGEAIKLHGSKNLSAPLDRDLNNIAPETKKQIADSLQAIGATSVSVVIPERLAYVFLTDIPEAPDKFIREAINFKLEEHVPISPAEALFEYDIVSEDPVKRATTVSVRVVSLKHIEALINIFPSFVSVVNMDTEGKALANIVSKDDNATQFTIHVGRISTVFIISRGKTVLFSSTLTVGATDIAIDAKANLSIISDEANKVLSYWNSHGSNDPNLKIASAFISGDGAVCAQVLPYIAQRFAIPVSSANVWANIDFPKNKVPEIEFEASLPLAPAIGLSLASS